jgi:hypothetical protein
MKVFAPRAKHKMVTAMRIILVRILTTIIDLTLGKAGTSSASPSMDDKEREAQRTAR